MRRFLVCLAMMLMHSGERLHGGGFERRLVRHRKPRRARHHQMRFELEVAQHFEQAYSIRRAGSAADADDDARFHDGDGTKIIAQPAASAEPRCTVRPLPPHRRGSP
jgi:hypothetical protein